MKGVLSRGEVGFLTLFEHFGYIEVGSYCKTPKLPIWVICSESHYSVFFSTDVNTVRSSPVSYWKELIPSLISPILPYLSSILLFSFQFISMHQPSVDVFYYDMLGKQDEVIRLTITMNDDKDAKLEKNPDLIPPLNLVLRTKWKYAFIDWNGSDPLL